MRKVSGIVIQSHSTKFILSEVEGLRINSAMNPEPDTGFFIPLHSE